MVGGSNPARSVVITFPPDFICLFVPSWILSKICFSMVPFEIRFCYLTVNETVEYLL